MGQTGFLCAHQFGYHVFGSKQGFFFKKTTSLYFSLKAAENLIRYIYGFKRLYFFTHGLSDNISFGVLKRKIFRRLQNTAKYFSRWPIIRYLFPQIRILNCLSGTVILVYDYSHFRNYKTKRSLKYMYLFRNYAGLISSEV